MSKSIKKIKVSGETYDIYDSAARENGAMKELVRWNGDITGLPTVNLMNGVDYYRISDALDNSNGEYIVAESPTLEKASNRMIGSQMGEMSLMFKLFSAVNNISLINSSITFQGKLETLLRKLANLAMPELDQDSLPLADSIRYGLSAILFGTTQLVTFVNVTKTTAIPADFLNNFYGLSLAEDIVFSPGLWVLRADASEMTGYKEFWVYPDVIYTLSLSNNVLFDCAVTSMQSLLGMFVGGMMGGSFETVYNVSVTGNSSYYTSVIRNYLGNEQATFEENEKVQVIITKNAGCQIDNVAIVNADTEEVINANLSPITTTDTDLTYEFYMPNHNVKLYVTATMATTTE